MIQTKTTSAAFEAMKLRRPSSEKTLATKMAHITLSDLRPQVLPVYGICGHIARDPEHTCGAYSCTQQYGW